MPNTPELRINGNVLPFWSSVTIDDSIESIAAQFSVEYSMHDGTPESFAAPLTFDGDELVELTLNVDGQSIILLTGWVDSPTVNASADGTQVTISGYSKTADLQACPVIPGSRVWKQRAISDIIGDLCEPLSVTAVVNDGAEEAAATKLETFKAEFGESISDAIARACEYTGLVAHAAPDGSLMLSRVGSDRTTTELRHGLNVKTVSVKRDARDRFSHYYVVGSGAKGFKEADLDLAEGKAALVTDLGVKRYRPCLLTPEEDVKTQKQRVTQAQWERNRRAARSLNVSIGIVGWTHASGVWRAGMIVPFESEEYGIGGDFVISSVSLSRRPDGAEAQLELLRPAAFEPRTKPLPRRRKARASTDFSQAEDKWHIEDTEFFEQFPGDAAQAGELDYQDTSLEPFE